MTGARQENARDAKRRRAHIIQTVLELASQPQLVAEDLIESADDRSGGDQEHQNLIDTHDSTISTFVMYARLAFQTPCSAFETIIAERRT